MSACGVRLLWSCRVAALVRCRSRLLVARVLAGHLQDEQADGQARERGDRARGGGQPVGEDDGAAGFGLDVANVPGDADAQADQGGGPRPDPLPGGPAVQVGDVQGELGFRPCLGQL
jgi:hypothetical protein